MDMSFCLSGLPLENFKPLFGLSDEELSLRGIERRGTGPNNDYPCRITLDVARPGENVLLLSYPVQAETSPYRSISPIFVRESAERQYIGYDEIPEQMLPRLMSVRAFDDRHYIVAADAVQGSQLGDLAERFLGNREISYLHVHHARWGCYVGRIDRA
jgi:Protein of unknown function (DUF1203)